MSNIKEIKEAVASLRRDELRQFRSWVDEFDAKLWDAQIERDVKSGKLDHLAQEALSELDEGKCTEL